MVLTDYIAGYDGFAEDHRRITATGTGGRQYHVRISLTRAAMWFMSLGSFPNTTDSIPMIRSTA